jgi:ABC-type hemin transport system substrate-binding protein
LFLFAIVGIDQTSSSPDSPLKFPAVERGREVRLARAVESCS